MKKAAFLLLLSCFVFVSCDKPRKPIARIDVDKTIIETGEYLSIKAATSSKYDHLEWTLPDGSKSTSTFTSFTGDTPGQYTIKLTAWSKKEQFQDEDEVQITVVESEPGDLMVWTPNPNIVGFQIYVDSEYKGTITSYYPNGIGSNPCGSTGCVTSTLSKGSHVVTATNGTVSFNGSAYVNSNGCTKLYVN